MASVDGEYLLVGRQTVDPSNILAQYGQGETRTVNMTDGQGMYVSSPKTLSLNVLQDLGDPKDPFK
jgi:hypothetical protein